MDDFRSALDTGDYTRIDEALKTGSLSPRAAAPLLRHAVSRNLVEATDLLLKRGVRPAAVQVNTLAKCRSPDIFQLLAQSGWPFKQNGHLVLHHVLDSQDIVDWLLDKGVQINWSQSELRDALKKGESDDTVAVLNQAAAQGNMDMFDHLVARGADPSRCLALHYAALYKARDPTKTDAVIAHLVTKYHFDVNADSTCGGLVKLSQFTDTGEEGPPLRRAICHHNLAAVKALTRHGADPSPALVTAIDREDMEALKLLLEAGGGATTGCRIAVTRKNIDAARICLEYGADPEPAQQRDAELASSESSYEPMDKAMSEILEHFKTRRTEEA